MEIQLSRGEVKWPAGAATATYTNAGKDVLRLAILQVR